VVEWDLEPREQILLARHESRRAECGGTFLYLRERYLADDGTVGVKMIRCSCGLRSCPKCSRASLAHRQDRLKGPWVITGTLTFPQRGISKEMRLRDVTRIVGAFFKRLRDAHRHESPSIRIRGHLDYAWVVELHKSGHPHVHWCSTADRIEWRWIFNTWRDLLGVSYVKVAVDKIRKPRALNAYLCKYLSKDGMLPEALAVIGNQRLYACTLKAEPRARGSWSIEQWCTIEKARLLYDHSPGEDVGLRVSWEYDILGFGFSFRRPATFEEDWARDLSEMMVSVLESGCGDGKRRFVEGPAADGSGRHLGCAEVA
jgi:hypothetical protein